MALKIHFTLNNFLAHYFFDYFHWSSQQGVLFDYGVKVPFFLLMIFWLFSSHDLLRGAKE